MKEKRKLLLLCFCLTVFLMFAGCGDDGTTGGTIEEPEITVEYLSDSYADQLMRDGATHYFGSLTVTRAEDNSYTAEIEQKKLVENADHENGYYIADRNIATKLPCNPEARITYISKPGNAPEIITIEELMESPASSIESADEKVYDIYEIGGMVELILAKELKK